MNNFITKVKDMSKKCLAKFKRINFTKIKNFSI